MLTHPDDGSIERFIRGKLPVAERRNVVRHLLSGCERCRAIAGRFWVGPEEVGVGPAGPVESVIGPHPSTAPRRYQRAIDRAIDLARRRRLELGTWRREAPALLAELLAETPTRRGALVRSEPRFSSLPLCDLILARRFEIEPGSPADGRFELAALAIAVVERLDPGRWGSSIVKDFEARAWAHFADALLSVGDRDAATTALERSRSFYALGSQDPWDWAEIACCEARLAAAAGREDEAAELATEAAAIYRRLEERDLLAETLAELGMLAARSGRTAAAIEWLSEAIERLDPVRRPRRLACSLTWLGALLTAAGRGSAALGHLWRARSLYERLGAETEALGVRWLEARTLLATDQRTIEGESALRSVGALLEARGLDREAAAIRVELAHRYLSEGRQEDLVELTRAALAFGQPADTQTGIAGGKRRGRRPLDPGTSVALLALRRAIDTGSATSDFAHAIARFLASGRPTCVAFDRP